MDASALERAIKVLEIRSDSLDSWLKFWIVLVVVGVVVEVFVVIKEHSHAVTAQAPPLPLQERQGGLAGPVPPHGVGEKFQCIAALDHTGPGHGEQAGGGYLAVGALVSE